VQHQEETRRKWL